MPRSQELARPLHAQPDPAEAEGGRRKLKALSRRQYTILNTDEMALSQMLTPREVQEAQTPWELRWQVLVGRMWNLFDEERAVNLALGMVVAAIHARADQAFTAWSTGPVETLAAGGGCL